MGNESKHQQVEMYIRQQIETGELKIGDQIPTEAELCELFGFSRMTVNKALTHLSDTGYIKRVPGRGSFVSTPQIIKRMTIGTSFTEDMEKIGLVAGSELISYELVKGEDQPTVAEKLDLESDDYMHYFVRLRTGDGKPMAVSYTYLSAKVIPALDVSCLKSSLNVFLKTLGISSAHADMEIRAVLPTSEQKKLLKMTEGALLSNRHVTYTDMDGTLVPYEYVDTCYNGDMYTYTF